MTTSPVNNKNNIENHNTHLDKCLGLLYQIDFVATHIYQEGNQVVDCLESKNPNIISGGLLQTFALHLFMIIFVAGICIDSTNLFLF